MSSSRSDQLHECPCTGQTLAKLVHPAILTILAGGPLHGYRIVEYVAKTPVLDGNRPNPTGVYRVLRALEQGGYVVSAWDLSDRGPARRSYRLTPAGRQCLDRWIETLDRYRRAIGKLLSTARQASAAGKKGSRSRSKGKQ